MKIDQKPGILMTKVKTTRRPSMRTVLFCGILVVGSVAVPRTLWAFENEVPKDNRVVLDIVMNLLAVRHGSSRPVHVSTELLEKVAIEKLVKSPLGGRLEKQFVEQWLKGNSTRLQIDKKNEKLVPVSVPGIAKCPSSEIGAGPVGADGRIKDQCPWKEIRKRKLHDEYLFYVSSVAVVGNKAGVLVYRFHQPFGSWCGVYLFEKRPEWTLQKTIGLLET